MRGQVGGLFDSREALLAPPYFNSDLTGSPCQHGSRGAHRLQPEEEKDNMSLIEDYYPTTTYLAGDDEMLEQVQVPVVQAICGPVDQRICGEGEEQRQTTS